jgi:hypothetical protein
MLYTCSKMACLVQLLQLHAQCDALVPATLKARTANAIQVNGTLNKLASMALRIEGDEQ